MANTNIAIAAATFSPNTTRYGQPSAVCVSRSNMRYAPVRSSTPIQTFTMRLKSAAICAATAGAGPLLRSAGRTATRYRMLPPTQAAAASICAARTIRRISNIIFQIFYLSFHLAPTRDATTFLIWLALAGYSAALVPSFHGVYYALSRLDDL